MSIAELHLLPDTEKLKIIEALWSDLAQNEAKFDSPAWHEDELRNTAIDFQEGRILSHDWEDAKKSLRNSFE